MKPIDLSALSGTYAVRPLGPADVEQIYALCAGNPQFYRYSQSPLSREQILADLALTPPGIPIERKYFAGYFDGDTLVAVLDLIDGYPDADTAYLGFFMVDAARQGQGGGSAIIAEALACLKALGFAAARLAIDEGNPQSTAFWKKQGFAILKRVSRVGGGSVALLAERRLA